MNEIPILYQNNEIYIVNKRAGVSVQGGKDVKNPLDEVLSRQVGAKVFPVHRLDKDTAGVLVVAKNHEAASKWAKLFSSRQIKKQYIAFCIGELPEISGKINQCVIEHGEKKNAVTHYVVEKKFVCAPTSFSGEKSVTTDAVFSQETISQVRLTLETGRMHQIRIHLAKIGCPIVGDDKHGNFRINKILRRDFGAKNLMLCAVSLVLPIDGAKEFVVPLPEHMRDFNAELEIRNA